MRMYRFIHRASGAVFFGKERKRGLEKREEEERGCEKEERG